MQFQNVKLNLVNNDLTLCGFSRAAVATGIYINELDILLDAGYRPILNKVPSHIFITHTHGDHVKVCTDYSIESTDQHYYIHQKSYNFLLNFIHSGVQMNKNRLVSNKSFKINPLTINNSFELNLNNRRYLIKIFDCYHNIPTIAYGFIEKRKKIKSIYINLSRDEIIELKKKNTIIDEFIEIPQFLFVGDTTIEFFESNDWSNLNFKNIIVECTYLYEDDYVKVKEVNHKNELKYMHIHWNDLKKYVTQMPETTFILIHFSTRYKDEEIKEFFKNQNFKNVIPFI